MMYRCMGGCVNGRLDGCMYEGMDGRQANEQIDRQIDGWADKRTD